MGLKERVDAFLLRNYPISIAVVVLVVFLMSILLPVSTLIQYNANLNSEIEPAIINGILTATAIVFGFVAYELREVKASTTGKVLLALPLLFFLMLTLEFYFISAIVGKVTVFQVVAATSNFLFNIFYIVPIIVAKGTHEELEQKKLAKP